MAGGGTGARALPQPVGRRGGGRRGGGGGGGGGKRKTNKPQPPAHARLVTCAHAHYSFSLPRPALPSITPILPSSPLLQSVLLLLFPVSSCCLSASSGALRCICERFAGNPRDVSPLKKRLLMRTEQSRFVSSLPAAGDS